MARLTKLLALSLLLGGTTALTQVAFADPPAPTDGTSGKAPVVRRGGLEEVTVTARRRSESAQKTPIAIAAFTPKAIAQQQITSIPDLVRAVPGFSSLPAAQDKFESLISLRGIATLNSLEVLDPAVGIYIDGVYQGFAGANLRNPYDVTRIEVAKGPQGTLYGRNSTGGAISIFHQVPLDKYEAWLKFGVASNNGYEGAGMVNLPLIPDELDLRVVGGYQTDDGYGKIVSNGGVVPQTAKVGTPLNNLTEQNLLATLRFRPTADLDIVVRASSEKGSSNGGSVQTAALLPGLNPNGSFNPYANSNWEAAAELGGPQVVGAYYALAGFLGPCNAACVSTNGALAEPYLVQAQTDYLKNPGGFSDSPYATPQSDTAKKQTVSVTGDYLINDNLQIKTITAYLESTRYDHQDYSAGPFDIGTSTQIVNSDQVTQEGTANGTAFGGRLKYTAGVFYYYKTSFDTQDGAFYPTLFGALGDSTNVSRIRVRSLAPYAQVTYAITPQINITGGYRYTNETKAVANQFGDFHTKFTDISYLGDIDYSPVRNTLLYVKTSRAATSGGQQETSDVPLKFAPEFVTDYEVGVKTDLLDHRLRVNLDAYHEDYTQLQQSVMIVAPGTENLQTVILNAGSAKVDGVEWQLTGKPVDALTLGVEGAYTYPHYTSFIDPSLGQIKDTPFSNVLRWSYTLLGDYELPTSLGPIDFHLDYHFQSRLIFSVEPTIYSITSGKGPLSQGAYGLLNGRIAFTLDKYSTDVAVYGKNMLDKHYYTFGSDASGSVVASNLGFVNLDTGDIGRTFGFDITKHF